MGGIGSEDAEAARGQVWAYDHATVLSEVGRKVMRTAAMSPSDAVRHARDDGMILPIEPDDWRAAKLARLLRHFGLSFTAEPSAEELLALCLEGEERAVALLRQLQGPRKGSKDQTPFDGDTVVQLAQYVLKRLFEELDSGFAKRPPDEQTRIADEIARKLAELPADIRERIRTEAGVTDLSGTALKQTGAIAAVGGAMVGTVGVAGFAAYMTLTSTIATLAGLFGAHLSFAFYLKATSMLAVVANPMLTGPVALVAGGALIKRANRQMRDRLVPVLVATSVMAGVEAVSGNAAAKLAARFHHAYDCILQGDRVQSAMVRATFPCLAG